MSKRTPRFCLGQRVRFKGFMVRRGTGEGDKWQRLPFGGEGIIAGKRNCTDGWAEWRGDYYQYRITKHHSFWLVAPNLSGCRYVAEEDIEAIEEKQS